MTIEVLHERGQPARAIARQLGVTEGAVRHRLRRRGQPDGRRKPFRAAPYAAVIRRWLATARHGVNLQALHEFLVTEYGYAGSYKSLQRYVRATYPPPPVRSRRRVETPPGAQGQVDWAEYRDVQLGDQRCTLYAFYLLLAHSRYDAVVWSPRKDQLAWLACHNAALRRLGGVPAVLRVDNERTAVARGAGPWGQIHPSYRAYARAVRFHVDATRPRCPGDKGKVERRIGDGRRRDPRDRRWRDLDELQAWTDAQTQHRATTRPCPATGATIWETYQAERPSLGPLPRLPEPFDVVRTRRVGVDATVRFEGRTYSVPFAYVERLVEVRGCALVVQIWADGEVVAEHPRGTRARLVLDPAHYEGPDTARVRAPVPLGRLGRRLQELAALPPTARPLDLYVALAEVAR